MVLGGGSSPRALLSYLLAGDSTCSHNSSLPSPLMNGGIGGGVGGTEAPPLSNDVKHVSKSARLLLLLQLLLHDPWRSHTIPGISTLAPQGPIAAQGPIEAAIGGRSRPSEQKQCETACPRLTPTPLRPSQGGLFPGFFFPPRLTRAAMETISQSHRWRLGGHNEVD